MTTEITPAAWPVMPVRTSSDLPKRLAGRTITGSIPVGELAETFLLLLENPEHPLPYSVVIWGPDMGATYKAPLHFRSKPAALHELARRLHSIAAGMPEAAEHG